MSESTGPVMDTLVEGRAFRLLDGGDALAVVDQSLGTLGRLRVLRPNAPAWTHDLASFNFVNATVGRGGEVEVLVSDGVQLCHHRGGTRVGCGQVAGQVASWLGGAAVVVDAETVELKRRENKKNTKKGGAGPARSKKGIRQRASTRPPNMTHKRAELVVRSVLGSGEDIRTGFVFETFGEHLGIIDTKTTAGGELRVLVVRAKADKRRQVQAELGWVTVDASGRAKPGFETVFQGQAHLDGIEGMQDWFPSRRVSECGWCEELIQGLPHPQTFAGPRANVSTLTSMAVSGCPNDMVMVPPATCIDRYEASVVRRRDGALSVSPFPIGSELVQLARWQSARWRMGDVHARAMPLPLAPASIPSRDELMAMSVRGVSPRGYVSGLDAEALCAAAGKRLCTAGEFQRACRGDRGGRFPYGDTYVAGACNISRATHPASALHGHASVGHWDPRLAYVRDADGPMLRPTGATPSCESLNGSDAAFDLVGNLDEWVRREVGSDDLVFVGGFFGRATESGCAAMIATHDATYSDYSTGFRCCTDAARAPQGE